MNRTRGLGLIGVVAGLAGLALAMTASIAMFHLRDRSHRAQAVRDEAIRIQTLIRDFIDCPATFNDAGINPVAPGANCQSTSETQVGPYLRLRRRARTSPAWFTEALDGDGKVRFGNHFVRASCSKAEKSLIVRVARVAEQVDFQRGNSLIIGQSRDPLGKGGAKVIPVCSVELTGVVEKITAGADYSCGILAGSAFCWGSNQFKSLGNPIQPNSPVPIQVVGLTSGVSDISGAATDFITCAVHNGAAKCWGTGTLGDGVTTVSDVPVQVSGLNSGVTAISVGGGGGCVIHNGAAKCWGANNYGQLGNNSTTTSNVPVQVQGLNSGVTSIAKGITHTCAVHNGAAKCWGWNPNGELGDGTILTRLTPVQVVGLASGITAISASNGGGIHSCAIHNGAAKCWGQGPLGDPALTFSTIPLQVSGLSGGVTRIAAGGIHACAIHNGAAKCWGANNGGQLGNNTYTDSPVPVQVEGITSGATEVATGARHSCGIHNGLGKCWGEASHGELGNNTSGGPTSVPVMVLFP